MMTRLVCQRWLSVFLVLKVCNLGATGGTKQNRNLFVWISNISSTNHSSLANVCLFAFTVVLTCIKTDAIFVILFGVNNVARKK